MRNTAEVHHGEVAVLERRTQPVTVHFERAVLEELRSAAREDERSVAAQVRHVIKRYLEDPAIYQ
jgi:hypothetical protein